MSRFGTEEKKEVLISIAGLHDGGEETDTVDMVALGEYYFRNGKHYLIYEDMPDDSSGGIVQNTMKLSREEAVLIKRKAVSAQMVFRPGARSETHYSTPAGRLHIGLHTRELLLEEAEDALHAEIRYSMDMNGEHISDSKIVIDVKNTGEKEKL